MKIETTLVALGLCALALAGCDRRDQKPMNTAAQQAAPEARTANSSANSAGPPAAVAADQSTPPPRADSKTKQEPPVQGQADARQPAQSQHFDNNKK